MFAQTPEPPYCAVIFTSRRSGDLEGYAALAASMETLAAQQPGFLGFESIGNEEGSITVSYWRDAEAAAAWKGVSQHLAAQRLGRERYYAGYRVRIARVERDYGFDRD